MDEKEIREIVRQELAAYSDYISEKVADHLFTRLVAMNLADEDGLQISISGRFVAKPARAKSEKGSSRSKGSLMDSGLPV